ncbi:hypothetical protein FACHB389_33695 [Nostoc calcicola FACHB-389]|nr:hypothetical protein [Nostoc calcicola FACHB-3891]OKH18828.1 hypothetical protein FACHB389_33695 [Nostoc calcicola FACHB-389]
MKQMITVAGGVFFSVGIMFLLLGGWSFWEKIKFENELKSRGQFNTTISKLSGWEELNKQELERKQNLVFTFLVIAGISGSLGVGLAIAGKNQPTQ